MVTPCVGVWIETIIYLNILHQNKVTPCVGVWIETQIEKLKKAIQESHPAWVCGLKLLYQTIWRS